jgi:hypothetical protein
LVVIFVFFDTPDPVDRVDCILGEELADLYQLVKAPPDKRMIGEVFYNCGILLE